MKAYKEIVNEVLNNGVLRKNRTGVPTYTTTGLMFKHDMSKGFPLLTTKFIPIRVVAAELEFFIKGLTDKRWLQERNCNIWNQWCSPAKVPYGHDEETRKKMEEERDLAGIYGFQWRHFGAKYHGYDKSYKYKGIDQLRSIVKTLKTDPCNRRMIVSAWNPVDLWEMALPPCHYAFQVTVTNDKLNLLWNQRSVDVALGLPFNIASYGILLTLLAKEAGFEPGELVGFLSDVHIYVNHVEGLELQIKRDTFKLPSIEITNFKSIFDWEYTDTKVIDYQHHPHIKFDISV